MLYYCWHQWIFFFLVKFHITQTTWQQNVFPQLICPLVYALPNAKFWWNSCHFTCSMAFTQIPAEFIMSNAHSICILWFQGRQTINMNPNACRLKSTWKNRKVRIFSKAQKGFSSQPSEISWLLIAVNKYFGTFENKSWLFFERQSNGERD